MKTISILLALLNSLAAAVVIAASLPAIQLMRPASALWNAVKVASSVAIIIAGILTWIAAARPTNHQLTFLAGLFLIMLGTSSAVWTVHIAVSTGALKDSMFLYGGSLMAQGTTSLWSLLAARGSSAV